MDISNTRLKELLNKYLEGTASAEEIREVDDWYRSFEQHKGLTEQLSAEQRAALEQLLFLRISGDIAEAAPAKVIRGRFRYWWAAAGIVLLLAAGGAYFALQRRPAPAAASLVMVTEKADSKSIKKIALPDGTVIWLNFGSEVRYAEQKGREVWLAGEAYFEVAPQQGKDFVVHSGKLDVQVLGTSFNVDAYSPGESVTVTVASGKVAVGKEADKITLTANQQALYQAAADKIEKYEISAADFSAWRQGQLVFRKASFRSIGQKLEHRYNVRIRFDAEPTANALLSARFDGNVPLKDILGMLCDIYGFSYRQGPGGNEYLIYNDQPR
jgi:ferric-dicitrate binding protein FerR (iron transport regulator)